MIIAEAVFRNFIQSDYNNSYNISQLKEDVFYVYYSVIYQDGEKNVWIT